MRNNSDSDSVWAPPRASCHLAYLTKGSKDELNSLTSPPGDVGNLQPGGKAMCPSRYRGKGFHTFEVTEGSRRTGNGPLGSVSYW